MFGFFKKPVREINVKIVIDDPHEWEENDAYALNVFLKSATGKKLMHKLIYSMYQAGLAGEGQQDFIKGMASTIDDINQFSVIHPKIDEHQEVKGIRDLKDLRPWF